MTKEVFTTLMNIGIPANLRGFEYLAEAVEICHQDPQAIHAVTKRLYPEIAKRCGTTSSRVERAIRHAIETCFERIAVEDIEKYFGATVSYTKGKLTNAEFIAALYRHMQFKEDEVDD